MSKPVLETPMRVVRQAVALGLVATGGCSAPHAVAVDCRGDLQPVNVHHAPAGQSQAMGAPASREAGA